MNKLWLRALGIFGILGGLTLFAGDMLFYYDPVNPIFLENMSNASDLRIVLSGVSALFATWFYLLGVGQVYYAFKPSPQLIRNIVVICLAAILVSYGIIHGAYIAIATTAKVAIDNNLNLEETSRLARYTNDILRLFIYPIFAMLSYFFIVQVWKNKTLYPRWMIFYFPLIPFLLKWPISKLVSSQLYIAVMGGYFNLILILFFLASTIALWNVKSEKT